MSSEVADLFVVLRAETAPFLAGMRTAGEEGEAFTNRMGGVTGVLTKVGTATAVAGVAIAGVSLKMAGDFEASMVKLTTTAGESQANLQMVSEGVKRIAVETGTATRELADGMYLVESAGFHGADGLTVLKAAAEGARAEQAPLAEVSNAVTSALKSYHLAADQSTTITNQMIAAVGSGKTTFGEFAGSLATVLPIASAAHVSFAEVGGAIATLTNHGTSAREATQELAFSIRSLQAPNNVAIQEMQRLGLSSNDVSAKLGERGLTGTIDLLQRTILEHMGPSGMVLLNVFNTSRQAAQDANTMIASMPKSLQSVAQEFLSGKVTLGEWRQQLKALPTDQANLAAQFANLVNKSQGFNQQLKNGGPSEETFNASMKKMMGGAVGLNTALMLGGESMADFEKNVKTVGKASQQTGEDIHGWEEITHTFNFQMSQLKERLETAAITIGTKLIPVVLKVVDFFREHKQLTEALGLAIGGVLVVGLVLATAAAWSFAAALWATGIPEVVLAIMALIAAVALLAMNWREVWKSVTDVAKDVADTVVRGWQWIADRASSIWHNDIVEPIKGAWRDIAAFFTSAWHAVADPIVDAWNWVSSITMTVWNSIHDFFAKWWPLLLVIFFPFVAIIIAIWNHFHEQIIDTLKTAWNAVTDFLSWVWNDVIYPAAQFVWDLIKWTIINPMVDMWQSMVALWNLLSGWLSSAWTGILNFARSVWDWISRVIIGPIENVANSVSNVVGSIGTSIKNGLSDAWNAAKEKAFEFANIGIEIINGIGRGIASGWNWLKDQIKNLAHNALAAAKDFLGINSPSKVFADVVGKSIPEGIAKGIDDHSGIAVDSVGNLTDSLSGSFNGSTSLPGLALAGTQGAAGGGTTVVVNVTVQGSVLSEVELRRTLEQQMYQLGMRNSQTWQPYARR
ncbi:phage tail tape measure protein [Kitasatospora sp. NPDC127116]|uniref:phage tail tape measure protein n=1 Tax=Kitasatospora sp. NPDC127116 TaxID=3345367 RepID=UPI00362B3806